MADMEYWKPHLQDHHEVLYVYGINSSRIFGGSQEVGVWVQALSQNGIWWIEDRKLEKAMTYAHTWNAIEFLKAILTEFLQLDRQGKWEGEWSSSSSSLPIAQQWNEYTGKKKYTPFLGEWI